MVLCLVILEDPFRAKTENEQDKPLSQQVKQPARHAATSELSYEQKESYNQQMHNLKKIKSNSF